MKLKSLIICVLITMGFGLHINRSIPNNSLLTISLGNPVLAQASLENKGMEATRVYCHALEVHRWICQPTNKEVGCGDLTGCQ